MVKIEDALTLACRFHAGQTDKKGYPYIYHLIRVAMAVPVKLRPVAILHDLLEDTEATHDDLRGIGCDGKEIATLDAMTRRHNESYPDYIVRLSGDAAAVEIKFSDIDDHMLTIDDLSTEDQKRLRPRYTTARLFLQDVKTAKES